MAKAKKVKKPSKTEVLQAQNDELQAQVGKLSAEREMIADVLFDLLYERLQTEVSDQVDEAFDNSQYMGCCHF